jgi:hypothetical protein
MNSLHTVHETDALPDLLFVLSLSENIVKKENLFDLNLEADETSRNFIIE